MTSQTSRQHGLWRSRGKKCPCMLTNHRWFISVTHAKIQEFQWLHNSWFLNIFWVKGIISFLNDFNSIDMPLLFPLLKKVVSLKISRPMLQVIYDNFFSCSNDVVRSINLYWHIACPHEKIAICKTWDVCNQTQLKYYIPHLPLSS